MHVLKIKFKNKKLTAIEVKCIFKTSMAVNF